MTARAGESYVDVFVSHKSKIIFPTEENETGHLFRLDKDFVYREQERRRDIREMERHKRDGETQERWAQERWRDTREMERHMDRHKREKGGGEGAREILRVNACGNGCPHGRLFNASVHFV